MFSLLCLEQGVNQLLIYNSTYVLRYYIDFGASYAAPRWCP
jgi:hypothetical protein